MNIPWNEFCVLCSLNYWPMDGLPEDYLAVHASCTSEGDLRGTISLEIAEETIKTLLERGWMEIGPASDTTNRSFAYPTEEGIKVFEENKEYWAAEWKKLREKEPFC